MSLEFNITCPIIDKGMERVKEEIKSIEENMMDLFIEFKEGDITLNELIEKNLINIKQVIENVEGDIEDLRRTNVLMRDAADKQIDALKEEITELELQKSNLTVQVDNLYTELADAEEEVDELAKQLKASNGG